SNTIFITGMGAWEIHQQVTFSSDLRKIISRVINSDMAPTSGKGWGLSLSQRSQKKRRPTSGLGGSV
ncbi:hypothetical protein CEXT_428751, partial [Caerostris extrusa]